MRQYVFVACVLSLGCGHCGAHDGTSTEVYQREGEMLIVCDNGGYVAMLSTTMLEGNLNELELAYEADTVLTPQLSGSAWTLVDDEVVLGHANLRCKDLTTRTWWNGA